MGDAHPIVGAWQVAVHVPGAEDGVNLALFGADGAVVVTFASPTPAPPGQAHRLEFYAPALGAWAPDGDTGASMRFVSLGADENGQALATHTVTASVTVQADASSWTGPFTITLTSVGGEVEGSVSGTVEGSRMAAS